MSEESNENGDATEGNAGSGGPSTGASDDSGNISSPVRPQLASEELLTSTEMMEAVPCDIIEISEEDIEQSRVAEEDKPEGPGEGEGLDSGGIPSVEADEQADSIDTLAGYDYPAPYTTHEVITPYETYPYQAVGKLFFKRGDRRFVCSASSIGNNAIWTAGHCLHSGDGSSDGWAEDVVFVPAYKDGNAPYGQWPVRQMWVKTDWYRNGNPNGLCQDMGGATLHPKDGRKISEVVGWLGFAWNWSRTQHWHALGYPAASPFNGQRMIETDASYAYDGSVNCSPKPVAIGCNQTGGSSGGPWIWQFGSGNYLMGNNSYRLESRPEEMNSPYFGDHAKSLKDDLVSG